MYLVYRDDALLATSVDSRKPDASAQPTIKYVVTVALARNPNALRAPSSDYEAGNLRLQMMTA